MHPFIKLLMILFGGDETFTPPVPSVVMIHWDDDEPLHWDDDTPAAWD